MAFSPDGRTILTGCADKMARLWDAATGRQIGPPLPHPGWVYSVAFSPDGQMILTGCRDKRAPLGRCHRPTHRPDHGASELCLDGGVSPDGRFLLTCDDAWRLWGARRAAARGLRRDWPPGSRPSPGWSWTSGARSARSTATPGKSAAVGCAARRAALARPCHPPRSHAPWRRAGAAGRCPRRAGSVGPGRGRLYLEAVRARPFDASWRANSAWAGLTLFYISRGRPEAAVAKLGASVSRWPDVLELRFWHCVALLAAGDRPGWERAIAGLLDRFPGPMNPWWRDADMVALLCALGPYPLPDREVPVRLVEAAIRNATEVGFDFKPYGFLNTLGAALYRAGRYDEAIRRTAEGIQDKGGRSEAQDWAFLALAHFRLGHRAEARRWLDRLRGDQPRIDPAQFWYELEIRLLRSEAEAVVLYDPIFPVDPFSR